MHSVRAAAGETGAVNNIGLPGLDRRQQGRVIPRIIFKIGILDQHDVTGDVSSTRFLALLPCPDSAAEKKS